MNEAGIQQECDRDVALYVLAVGKLVLERAVEYAGGEGFASHPDMLHTITGMRKKYIADVTCYASCGGRKHFVFELEKDFYAHSLDLRHQGDACS